MASIEELQIRLAEARAAYHRLMIGDLEASVGSGDTQVSFSRASAGDLRNYIAEIEGQIVKAQGQNRRGCRRLEIYF